MEMITNSSVSSVDSKYQITEISFNIVLVLTSFVIFGNLLDLVNQPAQFTENLFYLEVDLITFSIIALLAYIHRKGQSRLAGILLLIMIVIVISASFDLTTLTQIMIIYALPILMASFLIGPASSFVFALVCTLAYSLAWAAAGTGFQMEFSLVNISMFFGLAALSWMVSKQVNIMMSRLKADEHRLKGMIHLYEMQDSSVQDIASQSLREAVWLTHSEFGYLALISQDEKYLSIVAGSKQKSENTAPSWAGQKFLVAGSPLWSALIQQRRPIFTNEPPPGSDELPALPVYPILLQRHLIVPVFEGSRIVAVMGMANKKQPFDESDANRLVLLARQVWSLVERRRMVEELEQSNQDLTEAYENTLSGWARTLEERNKETQQHSQRVVELSERLGRALGLPQEEIDHLRRGALLHDIGKMGIPDDILLKKGPLTDSEWEIMRRHPEIAYKILAPIKFLQPALDVPYCHHERWDGTGYPRGLRETEIPLPARIFAVVDVWEALTHDRVYHQAWALEKAAAYLQEQAGRHFDPLVVEVFLSSVIAIPKDDSEPEQDS